MQYELVTGGDKREGEKPRREGERKNNEDFPTVRNALQSFVEKIENNTVIAEEENCEEAH